LRHYFALALLCAGSTAFAQQGASRSVEAATGAQMISAEGQYAVAAAAHEGADAAELPDAPDESPTQPLTPALRQQPKRILGIMPNYRAVSAGAIPPPPTAREAFVLATQNSFDYSSYVFVGITSLLAEGSNAHPQLGKGPAGFWGYTWRGFVDKTDGNYLVIFVLPAMLHEDERYYAIGKGGIWKRGIYAGSRVIITPSYSGHNTFNASEIFGRAISQGVSLAYYPSQDRTFGDFAEKYGYAVGRDALTNAFREFWPDIAAHLLHRHSH
jgi:hypothetical protein